jgi:hypothetical protein
MAKQKIDEVHIESICKSPTNYEKCKQSIHAQQAAAAAAFQKAFQTKTTRHSIKRLNPSDHRSCLAARSLYRSYLSDPNIQR